LLSATIPIDYPDLVLQDLKSGVQIGRVKETIIGKLIV